MTTRMAAVGLAVLLAVACPVPAGRDAGAPGPGSIGTTTADGPHLRQLPTRDPGRPPPLPSTREGDPPPSNPPVSAVSDGPVADIRESLQVEQAERDPHSDMVTIKLLVEPPKRAHAFWGTKDMGVTPLEIRRPRGSGPVDLAIRAPGYLTVHTRAFTDRDDHLNIRLVPEAEAPRTFGYRAPEPR